MSRHQRIIIDLSLHFLRAATARSGKGKVDTIEVRLALRCRITHCPERWPLDMFWNSAGTDHDIGRAQGCTAALARPGFRSLPGHVLPAPERLRSIA